MLIDTHCHLYFDAFDADRDAVILRAREFGVGHLVNVGTDPDTNEAAWRLSSPYDFMSHTAGLHPHSSHLVPEEEITRIEAFVRETRPVAIGEIGLDYYKSEADPETQKNIFARMLRLAMLHGLPAIVHSRNAFKDTVDVIRAETGGKLRGVMHCFSYDRKALDELLEIGFLASFTANITYKSASALLEVAKAAPLDRIMLETDSPYLAPQAQRGKRNEPAYLLHLSEFLAAARGIDREVLEEATSRNAMRLFGLRIPE